MELENYLLFVSPKRCNTEKSFHREVELYEGAEIVMLGFCQFLSFRCVRSDLWLNYFRWWPFVSMHFTKLKIVGIVADRKIVHFSYILPKLSRIPEMEEVDFEIGPCWTEPDYRGKGYYTAALSWILQSNGQARSRFWILCRESNHSSIAGVKKAGFELVGPRTRKRRLIISHTYQKLP